MVLATLHVPTLLPTGQDLVALVGGGFAFGYAVAGGILYMLEPRDDPFEKVQAERWRRRGAVGVAAALGAYWLIRLVVGAIDDDVPALTFAEKPLSLFGVGAAFAFGVSLVTVWAIGRHHRTPEREYEIGSDHAIKFGLVCGLFWLALWCQQLWQGVPDPARPLLKALEATSQEARTVELRVRVENAEGSEHSLIVGWGDGDKTRVGVRCVTPRDDRATWLLVHGYARPGRYEIDVSPRAQRCGGKAVVRGKGQKLTIDARK